MHLLDRGRGSRERECETRWCTVEPDITQVMRGGLELRYHDAR